jgi:hypothetical protein
MERRGRPDSVCYGRLGHRQVGSSKCPFHLCFACSTSHRLGERADVVSFSFIMICLVGMEYFRASPRGHLMRISFMAFLIRLVPVVGCFYLNLDHATLAFSLPLNHQCSSSSLQHLAHSHISIRHVSLFSLQSAPPFQT